MKSPVCPACGARLAPGAEQCDLCGHVMDEGWEAEEAAPEPEAAEPEAVEPEAAEPEAAPVPAPAATSPRADQQFCMACGTANPAFARFCYQCGAQLYSAVAGDREERPVASAEPVAVPVAPVPAEAPARPPSDAGRRALTLLGVAALAVVVLYFATQWSQNARPAAPADSSATVPPPEAALPADVANRAAALEDEITVASGAQKLAKQEELVALLAQNGAFAQAGAVQVEVAEVQQTALAWADAGSYFLAYMLRTSGPDRPAYARRAAAAYERALALDPADLDVKTDLATAYLNDEQNPMKAVETVKEVLDAEPEHVRARFNYGLMLSQINRLDQAREQFEQVVALTPPGDPVRQRAEQELARIQSAGGPASG